MKLAVLRPAARADLIEIWDYSARRWGEDVADQYIHAVAADLNEAANSPQRGSIRDWVFSGLRKWDVRNHHAFYLEIDGGIDVVRILHPSMDVGTAIST